MTVRTRMAPSPTGNLHLGTAYATLWPYVFARHHQGEFILRFEDTDQARSTKDFEANILHGLEWLGFTWDLDPPHQMDRLDIYQNYADKLVREDKAYYCFCSKEGLEQQKKLQIEAKQPQIYSGKCRSLSSEEVKDRLDKNTPYVIRFKMPENRGKIELKDLIHGDVSFEANLIGDMVIMRQNGVALYNFAVVVDDIEMKITHVIRGDDHLSNTPKQVVLFEAFGAPIPQFMHAPMILNQDRIGKLSKRTGSTSVDSYKEEGYLPEAMINYLASLGWSHPEGKEIFSIDELIEKYEISQMTGSAAAWNEQKLDWINGEYIRAMSDEELTRRLEEFLVDHPAKDKIAPVVPLIKERIKKLSDFIPLTYFFWEKPDYDKETLSKLKVGDLKMTLDKIGEKLESMDLPWGSDMFEKTFKTLAEELQISNIDMFQLLRVIVTGQLVSPPLFESIQLLGEDEVKSRLNSAKANLL